MRTVEDVDWAKFDAGCAYHRHRGRSRGWSQCLPVLTGTLGSWLAIMDESDDALEEQKALGR